MKRNYYLLIILFCCTAISSVCRADDEVAALPFEETFDNAEALNKFVVIDGNNDGTTWEYALIDYGSNDLHAVRYAYSSQKANEWLLTPKFFMEPGREYTVKFEVWISSNYWNKEYLELACGTGDDPNSYDIIVEEFQASGNYNSRTTIEKTFTVTSSGDYRVGFHCTSRSGQQGIFLDNIKIEAGAASTSPAAVSNFVVTPAPLGELKATISFTTPTLTTEGNTLTAIQKVEVKRNKQLVKTFDAPSTGQNLEFEDVLSENGMATYTAVAYGTDGSDGTPATASAWVGIDEPGQVMGVSTRDNYAGDIVVTWQAPSQVGVNGGYVDLSALTYNVYLVRSGVAFPQQREMTTFEYTDQNVIYSKTEQELYNYAVSVTTAAGEGAMKLGEGVLVGDCYTLPFHESFKGGMSYYWWLDRKGENSFRRISQTSDYQDLSSDKDWGAVTWTADKAGDEAWLNSGKIDLSGAANPMLSFSAYCYKNTDAKVEIEIWDGDNNSQVVETIDMNNMTENTGWKEFFVDLSPFASKNYVVVHFHVSSNVVEMPILLDNINVADNIEYNLLTTIEAPTRGLVGDKKTIKATVGNNGRQDIGEFKVMLLVNGDIAEERTLQNIPHNTETDIEFSYTIKPTDGELITLQTQVSCDTDDIDDDNISNEVEMKVGLSDLPAVNDLRAAIDATSMTFAWSKPSAEGYQTTDGFDFYEAWQTNNFGPWTTVDGDKGLTYDLGYQYEYPHHGEEMAFIVFNPSEAGINTLNNPQFEAYSNDQYLACFDADTELTPSGNNDWLISPELSGNAQTVKFYAKSISSNELESFEVATSNSGAGISNFTNKVLTVDKAENDWNRYTAEIPAGTRRFAIHVTSKDCFALLVDDITYEPKQPEVMGYRLWCNGELVEEMPADATSLKLSQLPSNNAEDYQLTVVYDLGESQLSNKCYDETVGIATANNADNSNMGSRLYTIDGKPASNASAKGVYIVRNANGSTKKVVIK